MRVYSEVLFIRREALVLSCWLVSFFNLSLWYLRVCAGLYLSSSFLGQYLGCCCCCCTQKDVLEQTVPSQDK